LLFYFFIYLWFMIYCRYILRTPTRIFLQKMQKLCQLRGIYVQLEKNAYSESKNVSFILNIVY
jgi:hypothetical protein